MTKFLHLFLLTVLFISCQTPSPENEPDPAETVVPPLPPNPLYPSQTQRQQPLSGATTLIWAKQKWHDDLTSLAASSNGVSTKHANG